MERYYTRKLFFKKFAYKILIAKTGDSNWHSGYTIKDARQFFKDNNIEKRMYNQVVYARDYVTPITETSSVFLKNRRDFNLCLDKWRSDVQSITAPYKDEHVQFLTENSEILIRKTLLYRRFRYVIEFKRSYKEDITEFEKWLHESFSFTGDDISARYSTGSWWPKLYLRDEADFVLTKLTYGDKISSITIIYTFDELETNSDVP
jgi:hypothetical protein